MVTLKHQQLESQQKPLEAVDAGLETIAFFHNFQGACVKLEIESFLNGQRGFGTPSGEGCSPNATPPHETRP